MEKYCPICGARYTGELENCAVDGMRLFERSDPLVGKVVDRRFKMIEKLGSGGMGSVYRVKDEFSGRVHALKLLARDLAAKETHKERFLREARAAARISHDHIITVDEFGEDEEGRVFMIMEYLKGRTLDELVSEGPFSPSRALKITTQLARGLGRAHDLDVIHRDIKPENIMVVDRDDDEDFVKILDFGLARMRGELRLTVTGQVFGTPEYVSPEQAMGEQATARSDLYALGVIIYEMLTGRLPFRGTATQIMLGHIKRDPDPPSKRGGDYLIPLEIDRLVMRLLQKDPAERFYDAHHLLEELEKCSALLPDIKFEGRERGPQRQDSDPAERGSLLDIPYESNSFLDRYKVIKHSLTSISPSDRPSWVHDDITELSDLFEEADALAAQIRDEARERIRQLDDVRIRRERLGHTVDVIAADESRVRRQVQILSKQKDALEANLATSKMHRREPSAHVSTKLSRLRNEMSERTTELADVQFKLEQLRGRLGAIGTDRDYRARTTGLLARDRAKRLADLSNLMDGVLVRMERFVDDIDVN